MLIFIREILHKMCEIVQNFVDFSELFRTLNY